MSGLRDCGLTPRHRWAYAFDLPARPAKMNTDRDRDRDRDLGRTRHNILFLVGGMHGHELSGSNVLHTIVQNVHRGQYDSPTGGALRRTDLDRCVDEDGTHLAMLMSDAEEQVWVIPTFSIHAACTAPAGTRTEYGLDNNRQFRVDQADRESKSPLSVVHLSNILLGLRGHPHVRVTVLDYHDGFGMFGRNHGMGHAVYGPGPLGPEVVRLSNLSMGRTDVPWSYGSGSLAEYEQGPVGSLRTFCARHLIAYVLVEISTERKAHRRSDVITTLCAAAAVVFGASSTSSKVLAWLSVARDLDSLT